MMNELTVTNVSARYSRTKQIQQYEPATSEVSMSGTIDDGCSVDDALTATSELMEACKTVVNGDTPTKATAKKPTAKKVAKKPAKKEDSSDLPDEKPTTKKTAASDLPDEKPTAKKEDASDLPDEKPTAKKEEPAEDWEKEDTEPMSASELQNQLAGFVAAKKLTVKQVKAVLNEFGAARAADTDPDKRADIIAAMEAKAED